MKNKTGSVLILSLVVVGLLLAWSYTGLAISTANLKSTHTAASLSEAFHVAEAGVDDAIAKLKDPDLGLWNVCDTSYNNPLGGEYTVKCPESNLRTITSFGDKTYKESKHKRPATRVIEVYGARRPPKGFYDNAIYAANGLDFKGGAYRVVGDVLTGDTGSISNLGNVIGDVVQDEDAAPLPKVDSEILKTIARSQGNYFDDWTSRFRDFPETFWYSSGVPNVVYVSRRSGRRSKNEKSKLDTRTEYCRSCCTSAQQVLAD